MIVKDLTPCQGSVMDLKSFETLVRTENTARLFFKKLCWKTTVVSAVDAAAMPSAGLSKNDFDASAVNIRFMTSPVGGSTA